MISLILLGILYLTKALIDNDFIAMILGLSLIFVGASLTLTIRIVSDSKAKRCMEIALLVASIGVIVYGYTASGTLILMIIASLIVAYIISGFIFSYLLPKIREEI